MQDQKSTNLAKLKSNIADLTNLVKCPICLKILNNPVELKCKHLFCESCIKRNGKGNFYKCPLCQKNVIKRNVKQADEVNGVLRFLRNVSIQVKDTPATDGPKTKAKKPVQRLNTLSLDKKQDKKLNENEPKRKLLKKNLNTNETRTKGKLALTEMPTDFNNTDDQDKYENYVKEWLSSSKNQFTRNSQTPQPTPKETPGKNQPKNLVSISQKRRRTLPNTRSANTNDGQRKFKSLEATITVLPNSNNKKKINIHDFDTPFDHETTIENTGTPAPQYQVQLTKSLICKVIEDKLLQEIDQNCHTNKRKQLEKDDTIAGQSHWTRVKKAANKIDIVRGAPKKLKVSTVKDTTLEDSSLEKNALPEVKKIVKKTRKSAVTNQLKVVQEKKNSKKTGKNSDLNQSTAKPKHKATITDISQNEIISGNFSQLVKEINEDVIKSTSMDTSSSKVDSLAQSQNMQETCGTKASTIPIIFNKTEEELLYMKFNEYLGKFDELSNAFLNFIQNKEQPCQKLILVHKQLQNLQPKFSSMSGILSSDLNDLPTNRMSQTNARPEFTSTMVQTSPVKICIKEVFDQEVQTENQSILPIKCPEGPAEFANTLDMLNFETQAAIVAADLKKSKRLETLTEGMPLTAIMMELQANRTHNTGWFEENQTNKEIKKTVIGKMPIAQNNDVQSSCRKKLYESPSSPVVCTSRRVQPLDISDSEEDSPRPIVNKFIRDDISLCFESESPTDVDKMNSSVVDKYLHDVWKRIQSHLEPSEKTETQVPETHVQDVQIAIKSKTQDIIEKCEQIISAKPEKGKISTHSGSHSSKILKTLSKSENENPTKSSSINLLSDSVFDDDFDFPNFETPMEALVKVVQDESLKIQDQNTLHNQHTPVKVLGDILICPMPPPIESSDEDLIFSTPESSPQKSQRNLAIPVLPPPPDFQDINNIPPQQVTSRLSEDILGLSPIQKSQARSVFRIPPRRRVTSTPLNKPLSISKLSQSPITHFVRKASPATSMKRPFSALDEECEDDLFMEKRVVLAATRLDKQQMMAITTLANRRLLKYSSTFDSSVSHLVVATNASNCAKDHTIKFVRAVAAGIWVVNFKWVQDCLSQNKLIPEENYEVCDVTGIDGPRQARLYRKTKPLFAGFKVYAAPPFVLSTPVEIQSIIRSLGGLTVATPEELLQKDGHISIIVTETVSSQDVEQYDKYLDWMEKFRVVTVDVEWLTRSIGQYKVMNLRRFALCPDDSLCNLGYPTELVEEVPFSLPSQY